MSHMLTTDMNNIFLQHLLMLLNKNDHVHLSSQCIN